MQQVELEETGMDTFVTSIEEFGRVEERRAVVLRQLNRKVGPLAENLHARVAALSPEQMLELSDALLDFTALDQLVAWLDRRESPSVE